MGLSKESPHKLTFALNGRTAHYLSTGSQQYPKLKYLSISQAEPLPTPPEDWPAHLQVHRIPFVNWSNSLISPAFWTVAPRNNEEALEACNWAARKAYRFRPRGIMHGWSPLTVGVSEAEDARVLLMDTTKYLREVSFEDQGVLGPRVRVGAGLTLGELMEVLEKTPGGGTEAPGWSFIDLPVTAHLTIGGMLAINAHGSAVPSRVENCQTSYGSLSNEVLELKVLASDPDNPEVYVIKTFKRGHPETKAFLTSLGRTVILEATLKVVPNYNLRCYSEIKTRAEVLFAPPGEDGSNPEKSIGRIVEESGRMEVFWFPFSECPWVKIWTMAATKPESSRKVDTPNNYGFSDRMPTYMNDVFREIVSDPKKNQDFFKMGDCSTRVGLKQTGTRDIWGTAKNTLMFVRDQIVRVVPNGHAIHVNRKDIQKVIHMYTHKYTEMLQAYEKENKYPINGFMEIRVTCLDDSAHVPTENNANPGRPVLSALSADAVSKRNNWDVAIWFNLMTIHGTPYCNEFNTELERWLLDTFNGTFARVRPEWSKTWGFTHEGPYTNQEFLQHTRNSYSEEREDDDNWNWAVETLQKYDRKNIFISPLSESLLQKI